MVGVNPIAMAMKEDSPMAKPAVVKAATTSRDSSFPVDLPVDRGLFLSDAGFATYIHELLQQTKTAEAIAENATKFEQMALSDTDSVFSSAYSTATTSTSLPPYLGENLTFTTNGALAYSSTNSSLLDLFTELEKTVTGDRLADLLPAAWETDPLTTLRIIWHARSIHLGKGEHESFYRSLGWLYKHHPETLMVNLPTLVRRVIAKKKTEEEDEDLVVIEDAGETSTIEQPELRFGVSHGYWKDLLNILVLAAECSLQVQMDPRSVLNVPNPLHRPRNNRVKKAKHRGPKRLTHTHSKESTGREERTQAKPTPKAKHRAVLARFQDVKYHALHLTVARLFATQLRKDKELLGSSDKKMQANISLAAKWAPSLEKFHDRHTCIASTIAELLFPEDTLASRITVRSGEADRIAYLRTAREAYRAEILAPLRKFLEVVETPISANEMHRIDYSTVPSLAMQNYKDLFAMKDFSRFSKHVADAAAGRGNARISGAVLQPSQLVAEVRRSNVYGANAASSQEAARKALQAKTLDAQWQSLVQRIKGAGSLDSVIAVADVSGSMTGPRFNDQTTPIDTAVGMALLIAEVAPAPFGGAFITFSGNPAIVRVGGPDDRRSFAGKVNTILQSNWSMNTDFGAVFMDLLLPLALMHQVKPEDMVKTIIVLSDMQFDQADVASSRNRSILCGWARKLGLRNTSYKTTHEVIRNAWKKHGYELPTLVYWNLNARMGARPVVAGTGNTMLVSGYSQGLLRGFIEKGGFREDVDEDESADEDPDLVQVSQDAAGNVTADDQPKKKRRVDPAAGLKRAVDHPAYRGLRVVD